MKTYKKLIVPVVMAVLPVVVLAEQPLTDTYRLVVGAGLIIKQLIILAAAVALLVFFWGLVKFIFRIGGDEKAVTEGKNIMKWGLIALFVMVSVWGIIGFFQHELGLPQTSSPTDNSQKVPEPPDPYAKYRTKP